MTVCVFCNTLCCASLLGLSVLNVTAHVCTLRQPIVGALVIHIRTHLLLRPSKGFTSGDEISWGHIKASHTPGCTVKEHQRDGVMLFPLPLLVLSAWIRWSPDHVFFFFFFFGLGRCLDPHSHRHTRECTHSADINRGLTWDIDYFLVHVQEGGLCFFTSLTQRIDLQGEREKMVNCQLHHLTSECHIYALQRQAH